MKSVLLSIQPKWCGLIASGKKTVEVRKTKPAAETPFKCYIYCSKSKKTSFWSGKRYSYADERSHNAFDKCGNGKVIGEFVCDRVLPIAMTYDGLVDVVDLRTSCLTVEDMITYANGKLPIFGWHISDLVIYDEPKELSKFWTKGTAAIKNCEYSEPSQSLSRYCRKNSYWCKQCRQKQITRPPLSWCYVECV